jgi:hypothetical protein
MSVPRFAFASIAVALTVLLGVPCEAQLGGILKKKIPKPGGAAEPASPASNGRPLYCANITDEDINKYLKAKEVQKRVIEQEIAEQNAKKAQADALKQKADALSEKRAQAMISTVMATEECKDKFKEKDPRSKKIATLEDQIAAASDRGDEAKADQIQKELSPLSNALEVDADRACGGRGAAALHDCLAAKKAALAKQGLTEPMLTIQAQSECMQNPATSGMAGATAASAEEQAATDKAAELLRSVESNADQAAADASGLKQHEFSKLDHCIRGVIAGDPTTPTTPESEAAINRRAADLKKVLR